MTHPIHDYPTLTTIEIQEQLCCYDPRNTAGITLDEDDEPRTKPCYCDNCFSGTAPLANQLLALMQQTTANQT